MQAVRCHGSAASSFSTQCLAAVTMDGIDTRITTTCQDLDAAIDFYTGQFGFRLDMIMPADAPRIAELSGHGITVRLEQVRLEQVGLEQVGLEHLWSEQATGNTHAIVQATTPCIPTFDVLRMDTTNDWIPGRAGMHYRDLLPGRIGGHVIASHIRIIDGGPVPDYVHYHHVGFQMIFCRRGWVRVVYEDQGPPFVMQAGDCVLQPPTIRHRVLESSAGLEVIEIGCPAEHETRRDHDMTLPTPQRRTDRDFCGQRFVRHVAADAQWQDSPYPGFESTDTGIDAATAGLASVLVLRSRPRTVGKSTLRDTFITAERTMILVVLAGQLCLHRPGMGAHALDVHALDVDDSCVVPAGTDHALSADSDCEVLQVLLPYPV